MNNPTQSQGKKKRGMNPPRMGSSGSGAGMSSGGSGAGMSASGSGAGMSASGSDSGMDSGGSGTGMGGIQRADLPTHRTCGTMDVDARLKRTMPRYALERAQIEQATLEFLRGDDATLRSLSRAGGCRIPVVVHVVWNQPNQNISDAQIHSQIDVLNRDFRILNPDISTVPSVFQGLIGNPNLEFFLATQAPDGSATSGIVRTRTNETSFVDDDKVKSNATGGSDAWPADRYLNMWVCQLAGGLLGYAQFPGGPAATDGVVITHTGFGTTGTASPPFHLGRTATHEIGHWLDLFHIWGDDGGLCTGTDQVSDTPNQGDANIGVPTFPRISCNNGPNGDLFMNYMDYVDDPAMVMFSQGQVARMHACLAGARASICSGQVGGAPSASGPVVAWGSDRLDIFVIGVDSALYHKWWDGSNWGPSIADWEYMGGICMSQPEVVAWGPDRLDVFVLGTDSALWHKWWDGSSWGPSVTDWESLGGICTSRPEVVAWGPNRLDVFVIGTDSALWHKWWDGSNWGPSVTDWESLGGTCSSRPEVVAWGPDRLDVFVLGTDNALYHKWWDGSAWGPSVTDWEYMGGACSTPPKVVAWGANRLDVFVLGTDHALYHKWWDGSAWGPSVVDYEYMGGICLGEPGVVSWGSNRLDVFVIGTDNAVWHKWWDGSAWGPSVVDYEYMGGICTSRPEAVAWSTDRLDLFVTGTDHALWHKWWDGSAWGPSVVDWEYLGGTISDF